MIKSKYNSTFYLIFLFLIFQFGKSQEIIDYVNPFIGTSNFGACHPGAITPRGMASVSPFNVAGKQNSLEKDSRWLSNPYVYENTFLTGFSHVNLSGVGCPDLGVILAMPTTGELETNHLKYGTTYHDEIAKAGYYSTELDKYGIKVETTATTRVGVSRYSFPKGKANVLLNLGLGLTNERGASLKIVSSNEVEGKRMVGSFCYYKSEETYPVYFVAKLSKAAENFGIWDKPAKYDGVEAEWMTYNGQTRLKEKFQQEVIGDSIGVYFSYEFSKPEIIELQIGISYVSIENARENLEKEAANFSFEEIYSQAKNKWEEKLKVVEVEGGTNDQKTNFYTALYHTQIHPNILNDVNGEFPIMGTRKTGKTDKIRYTVFSLWDTYRNYHQLMSLLYPEEQLGMVESMLEIYKETVWMPKWELNSTETTTMVGDPASIVIADTYLRGITGFDVETAYEGILKSATQIENNLLRPGLKDYVEKGYLSLESGVNGVVSVTQEYNTSDFAIAQLAKQLGKKKDFEIFKKRSVSYRKLFDSETGFLRPRHDDGSWIKPFNPLAGANFEFNPGFIEGNAWQYLFMLSHDVRGLEKLMGGRDVYLKKLNEVFSEKQFDMANEPDFAYPFLYNYFEKNWLKASEKIKNLMKIHYKNAPDGLPGNDDTGTMSAWLVFSMMGFYPIVPAEPSYTIIEPSFSKIILHLDPKFYKKETLYIEKIEKLPPTSKSAGIFLKGNNQKENFILHQDLVNAGNIQIIKLN